MDIGWSKDQMNIPLEHQEELTLNKIYAEMEKEDRAVHTEMLHVKKRKERKTKIFSIFQKRNIAVITAMVMMLGVFVYAKEADWDIKMAEMLGLSYVMDELDGGYVRIDEFSESEGVTITASQSIGDRNTQWIQIDTNIPWEAGEKGYYLFEDWYEEFKLSSRGHPQGSYGSTCWSYNNSGCVSFIIQVEGLKKINRAYVDLSLEGIRLYQTDQDEEGEQVSAGIWHLTWKNSYAANIITRHPYKRVSIQAEDGSKFDCIISKIEISPVSLRIEAWKNPKEGTSESCHLKVDSITLQDGTRIQPDNISSGNSNNCILTSFLCFDPFSDMKGVNLQDIDYVTICGEDISIH